MGTAFFTILYFVLFPVGSFAANSLATMLRMLLGSETVAGSISYIIMVVAWCIVMFLAYYKFSHIYAGHLEDDAGFTRVLKISIPVSLIHIAILITTLLLSGSAPVYFCGLLAKYITSLFGGYTQATVAVVLIFFAALSLAAFATASMLGFRKGLKDCETFALKQEQKANGEQKDEKGNITHRNYL